MANQGADIQNLMKLAIKAANEGNKESARVMFRQIIQRDAQNEQAMMWMVKIARNTREREQWLKRVLKLNPDNISAQKALEKIAEHREYRDDRMVIIYGVVVVVMLIIAVVVLILVVG